MYVLFQYANQQATVVFAIYSVVLFFLLLKASALFSLPNFNFKLFFIGIASIAWAESVYCMGQFLGFFKSLNQNFTVTGSWNNPNVTAIFLALTVPVFLYLFQEKYKKIAQIGFFTLLLSILLLKCRAAYIGSFLSIIVFYGLKFKLIDWIKDKKNSTSVKGLLIISLLIIIPISSHLYNAKKASADGRKFIWKVATLMAIQKPVTGYGYGFFEKEYNLYQAQYIQKGKATTSELANAGPVIMPHNELIQNTVEGGCMGLLLISLFFTSLLFSIKKKQKNAADNPDLKSENAIFYLAYAGILAFVVMSMVNSTMQIVPIMCLFIVYSAIVCSKLEPTKEVPFFSFIKKNKSWAILSNAILITSNLYLLYLVFGMAAADKQNKNAKLLKQAGQYQQALQLMPGLEKKLNQQPDYWLNYGYILFKMERYHAAWACFEKAKSYSSLPEMYGATGICLNKLKQYPKAIQEYETLINLYPSKFLYKMLLLDLYLKNKDTTKAITLAQAIIDLKPKVPSQKVERYKRMCKWILGGKLKIKS